MDFYHRLLEVDPPEKCALCRQGAPEERGHVHPRLVSRYIGKVTGSMNLRFSEAPLKRQQDTVRIRMLCKRCEAIFGGYEQKFARMVLKPYFSQCDEVLTYDGDFHAFLLSVAWRALFLASLMPESECHPYFPKDAMEQWRASLDARKPEAGHYLFAVLDRDIKDGRIVRHPFLTRASLTYDICQGVEVFPDMKLIGMTSAFVYVQLGPLHLFAWAGEQRDWAGAPAAPLIPFRVTSARGALAVHADIPDELFYLLFRIRAVSAGKFSDAGVYDRPMQFGRIFR